MTWSRSNDDASRRNNGKMKLDESSFIHVEIDPNTKASVVLEDGEEIKTLV